VLGQSRPSDTISAQRTVVGDDSAWAPAVYAPPALFAAPGRYATTPELHRDTPHKRGSAMKPSEQPKESPGWAANPKYVVDWDLVPAKVSVSFNGTVVAESDQVRVMYELGHAPVYYFPKSALNPQFLEKVADHHTFCPYKGVASYMTLTVGDKSQPHGVWMYENPYPQQEHLKDHVGFYWGKMGEWREDGERVPGPREIPGRIDTTNQLKAAFPQLAKEWNEEKNKHHSPYEYSPESNQEVWWRDASGHEWRETIKSRVLKTTTLRADGDATPYG
jgi:uncharacterized protein (DUF427 family)